MTQRRFPFLIPAVARHSEERKLGATPPPAGLGRTAVTCTGDLESSPLHIWGTRDDHDLKAAWVLSNKEGLVAHFPPASDSS